MKTVLKIKTLRQMTTKELRAHIDSFHRARDYGKEFEEACYEMNRRGANWRA